ncbi:MAG: glycosyltransferase family 9 protein [Desulfobacterales bacterium]
MKILIIRLSSIGDIILTTPVLDAIKSRFPDAVIDFLVMDRFKEAISGTPWIDNLILFEKEKHISVTDLVRFSKKLNKNNYDIVIDLHAKIRSIVIAIMLKAKVLRYKKRAWWKSVLVPLRLIKYHVDDTIVVNYFMPLKKIGIHYTGEKLKFYFSKNDLKRVSGFNDFIVMAPGAANYTKQWPKEYFAQLGKILSEKIILIGGKSEYDTFEDIRRIIGDRCENLAGKLSLKESGALISKSKYIITNDSGTFHIARGVSKKAFVIFGPTDPGMFEYDADSILLYDGADCSPCSLHGDKKCPKKHFSCMMALTPERVYKIIIDSV